MSIVAEHIQRIRGSETKAMTARAAALRAQGRSIITLSQGEPDFPTPSHVVAAGMRAMTSGHTRYTAVAGVPELRAAIAHKLLRDNGAEYAVDQITVGCGAKQVIFNALLASVSPGDEVVVPAPCWVSYPEMVRLAGGNPVVVSTVGSGFKLTPSQLEQAITPRTRWVILNSPSNPAGTVHSAEELRALAGVLERHDRVWVLSDDIYEKLTYDEASFATMASAAPSMRDRTLIVNGLSKSHAMTGWRVGYGAGPLELIRSMNIIQSQTTSHTSSISQHAAVEALTGSDTFLAGYRAQYQLRRDLVVSAMNEVPGLTATVPQGAFYVFVGCEALLGAVTPGAKRVESDTDLAMFLLEEAGVAIVPGSGFLASPFFRISYASAMKNVAEGCARIAAACRRLDVEVSA